MRKFLILFMFLLAFGFTRAEVPSYRVIPDVIYARKAGVALTYDVLIPEDHPNGAGIIHIVSAGWKSSYLPIDSTQAFYAPLLEKGYTVFVLRHASAPYFKLPDIVNDVQKGVDYISQHAAEYQVDARRLLLAVLAET